MKKLIIFDCDGTLVDSEKVACEVFPNYWSSLGVHYTVEEFKQTFIGVGSESDVVKKLHQQLPGYADVEGDRLFDEALARELTPVSGISELLDELKNVDKCVASNSSLGHVKRAMSKTKLDAYFGEQLYSAKQVEKSKPAPDLFLHVAKDLNYAPSECIVVEDSSSGILAAKNAGMEVIAFSGAAHFTPSLEDRLMQASPDWLCSSAKSLGVRLNSLI